MRGSGYIVTCAVVALTIGLGACGGSSSTDQVARIGDRAITSADIAHWVTVLRGGSTTSGSAASSAHALRKQALEFLISAQWLIGEAASREISISGSEVRQQIASVEHQDFSGGTAELSEFLKSTGETVADIELQARAELAAAKLHRMALDTASAVTPSQVAAYYAQHKLSFLLRGRREAKFLNRKTWAAAEKIKREVEAGKNLTPPERAKVGEVYEVASVPPYPNSPGEDAIDASKPHVVSGPYELGKDWYLYEVVHVIPRRQQTLSEVAGSIRRKLTSERRQRAVAAFVAAWTAEWTAKTDCSPGYVVPRCRQYTGPATGEDPFSIQ